MAAKKKDRARKALEKKNERLETLSIEYVPIDSIKPNDYNPNRQSEHEHDLLIASMREDGFTQPVIVVREERIIVDGYHRWKAAHEIGMEEIPVVFTDMNIEQARIATLRHNRARGTEDLELSAQVLRDLDELGALDWAADSLMMTDAEINKLLEDIPAAEALAGEEFGEAWEPGQRQSEEITLGDGDGDGRISSTLAAAERVEASERAVAAAKTEEEKRAARRDANVFRIYLTFSGEEGEIVKEVLGERPAQTILELCQAQIGERMPVG